MVVREFFPLSGWCDMCEPLDIQKIEAINIKGVRNRNEIMKFIRFCDGKPHMKPIVEEIAKLYRETQEFADIGDDPVDFLFHEFMLSVCEQNFTRAIAAKFLLRL